MKNNFIVDSHCHLHYEGLYQDLDNIILSARSANIKYLHNISTSLEESKVMKNISEKYHNVYSSVGIHPLSVNKRIAVNSLLNLLDDKVISIGETGLDYLKGEGEINRDAQKLSFRTHIEVSLKSKLPLIIHMRGAEEDTISILEEYKNEKNLAGVIHCFTSTLEFAKEAIKLGFYISASGIITFKNSLELQNIFSNLPIEKLLIETDAPFLAPMPYRGKINRPEYIKYTAQKLAEIKKIDFTKIVKSTSNNFLDLFRIKDEI